MTNSSPSKRCISTTGVFATKSRTYDPVPPRPTMATLPSSSLLVTLSMPARLEAVSAYLKTDSSSAHSITGKVLAVTDGSMDWAGPIQVVFSKRR